MKRAIEPRRVIRRAALQSMLWALALVMGLARVAAARADRMTSLADDPPAANADEKAPAANADEKAPAANADEKAPAAKADEKAPAAKADDKAPAADQTAPALEISGFVDTYYSYNFNKGDAQLRNFDTKHNQFAVSLLEIALEQKATSDSRLGFRADLQFGPVADLVHAFEPGGAGIFKNFEQTYVSYLAPAGKGLQIDAGKFVTPHGAEVIEAKDNWNYSRSLLFALAIPYYHVGARLTYPVSDKLSLAGYLVNGWNNGVDNNSGKTFGAQALIKPSGKLTIVQNVMFGPEQADNDDDNRFLSDTTVTLNATPSLSLMANYDYGKDRFAGADVSWQGVAVYARFQATPRWTLAPRVEWIDDDDGFMTGTSQKVKEITLTSEHKIGGGLLTRLEFRRDFSDQEFFVKSGSSVKDQNTFTLGVVYAFNSKL